MPGKKLRLAMDTLDKVQERLTEGEYLALCDGLKEKYEEKDQPIQLILHLAGECARDHQFSDFSDLDANVARIDLSTYDPDPDKALESILPVPFTLGCLTHHMYEMCCYLLKLHQERPLDVIPLRPRIENARFVLAGLQAPWMEEIRVRLGALVNPCTREHVSNFDDLDGHLARLDLATYVQDPIMLNPDAYEGVILPCADHHVYEMGVYLLKLHETNHPEFEEYRERIHGILLTMSKFPHTHEIQRRLHRAVCSATYVDYSDIEKDIRELDLTKYDPCPKTTWNELKVKARTTCPQSAIYELCVYFVKLKREKPEVFGRLRLEPFYEQLRESAVLPWMEQLLTLLQE
jgi:hypothetical protein